jgi:transposase
MTGCRPARTGKPPTSSPRSWPLPTTQQSEALGSTAAEIADREPQPHSRRLDEQAKQIKKQAAAVKASGTTLTEIFGIGPVVAAIVLGEAEDMVRFHDRDHFTACNGTEPVVDLALHLPVPGRANRQAARHARRAG